MAIKFSAAENGFYDTELTTEPPVDAVTITTEMHAALLAAQAGGAVIRSDTSGYPTAVSPTELTAAELRDIERGVASMPLADFIDSAVVAGLLTDAEADEFIDRSGPQTVTDYIASLDPADQPAARRRIYLISEVPRLHPIVLALAAAKSVSAEAIDAVFGIGIG